MCYFCTKHSYEDLLSLISNTYFFSQNLFTACQTSTLLLNGISYSPKSIWAFYRKNYLYKIPKRAWDKNLSVGYKNMTLCVSMKTVNILESEREEAIVSLYASFFTCRNVISHFLDLIQLWGETANKKYYEVPWILKSAWSSWLTIIHKVQILKWLSGIIPNQEIASLVLHSNEEKQCEVLLLYQFKWTWWWISLIMDCVL